MNFFFLLSLFAFPFSFFLFRSFLNEDLLLLFASLLFFSFFYLKLKNFISDFFELKVGEVRNLFEMTLSIQLMRLNTLISFGNKLIQVGLFVFDRFFKLVFFSKLPSGSISPAFEGGKLFLKLFLKRMFLSVIIFGEGIEAKIYKNLWNQFCTLFRVQFGFGLQLLITEGQLT